MTIFQTSYYIARSLKSRSISSMPLYYAQKRPHYSALQSRGYIGTNGKAEWKTLQLRLPTNDDLKFWYSVEAPVKNLALITSSNLGVIDFDCLSTYWQFHNNYPHLTKTLSIKSHRGVHLVYRFLADVSQNIISASDKMDWLINGASCTIYGKHSSGGNYEILGNGVLGRFDVMELRGIEELLEVGLLKEDNRQMAKGNGEDFFLPLGQARSALIQDNISKIKSALTMPRYFTSILHQMINPTRNNYFDTHCPVHKSNHSNLWLNHHRCGCRSTKCQLNRKGGLDVIDFHALLNNLSIKQSIFDLLNYV